MFFGANLSSVGFFNLWENYYYPYFKFISTFFVLKCITDKTKKLKSIQPKPRRKPS